MSQRKTQGFTLLEVLIALIIFSLGFLPLSYLQITNLRQARQMLYTSIAMNQLSNLAEALLVSPSSECDREEFQRWRQDNQRYIPTANSTMQTDSKKYRLTLSWNQSSSFFLELAR